MPFFLGNKQVNSANGRGVLLGKPIRISVSGRCVKLRVPVVSTNGYWLGGKRVLVVFGIREISRRIPIPFRRRSNQNPHHQPKPTINHWLKNTHTQNTTGSLVHTLENEHTF